MHISCLSVTKWLIGMVLIAVLAGLLMILESPTDVLIVKSDIG